MNEEEIVENNVTNEVTDADLAREIIRLRNALTRVKKICKEGTKMSVRGSIYCESALKTIDETLHPEKTFPSSSFFK